MSVSSAQSSLFLSNEPNVISIGADDFSVWCSPSFEKVSSMSRSMSMSKETFEKIYKNLKYGQYEFLSKVAIASYKLIKERNDDSSVQDRSLFAEALNLHAQTIRPNYLNTDVEEIKKFCFDVASDLTFSARIYVGYIDQKIDYVDFQKLAFEVLKMKIFGSPKQVVLKRILPIQIG